jgi:hypothetical protein
MGTPSTFNLMRFFTAGGQHTSTAHLFHPVMFFASNMPSRATLLPLDFGKKHINHILCSKLHFKPTTHEPFL